MRAEQWFDLLFTEKCHSKTKKERRGCPHKQSLQNLSSQLAKLHPTQMFQGAVSANTNQHVAPAPMTSCLLRNGTWFECSENFKCLPAREVMNILSQQGNRDSMAMSVMSHDSGYFLTNEALHCLHRPTTRFEDLCQLDFFQKCEVIRISTPDEVDEADGTFTIDDEEHPGHKKQIMRWRKVPSRA